VQGPTQKSTVKMNSLDPDWKPVEKFTFDLSSGEMDSVKGLEFDELGQTARDNSDWRRRAQSAHGG
jgi:hypothetical protein